MSLSYNGDFDSENSICHDKSLQEITKYNTIRKSRIRTKVAVDWDENSTIQLIYAVQAHDVLWNVANEDKNNRKVRDKAWEDIATETFNNRYEVEQLSVKWTNLRIQFKSYDAKLKDRLKDGHEIDDNKVSWKYYNYMSFIVPQGSEVTVQPQFDADTTMLNSQCKKPKLSENLEPHAWRKTEKSNMISIPLQKVEQFEEIQLNPNETDGFETFGIFIVSELRKISNPRLANQVQRKLTRYLMDCLDEIDGND